MKAYAVQYIKESTLHWKLQHSRHFHGILLNTLTDLAFYLQLVSFEKFKSLDDWTSKW